jgi:hypothetical protein
MNYVELSTVRELNNNQMEAAQLEPPRLLTFF